MAGRWSVMARPRVGDWSPTEAGLGSFFLPGRIWPVFSLSFSSLCPCVFKGPSDGEEKATAILLDPNFVTWTVLCYYDAGLSHSLNMCPRPSPFPVRKVATPPKLERPIAGPESRWCVRVMRAVM